MRPMNKSCDPAALSEFFIWNCVFFQDGWGWRGHGHWGGRGHGLHHQREAPLLVVIQRGRRQGHFVGAWVRVYVVHVCVCARADREARRLNGFCNLRNHWMRRWSGDPRWSRRWSTYERFPAQRTSLGRRVGAAFEEVVGVRSWAQACNRCENLWQTFWAPQRWYGIHMLTELFQS